METLFINDKKLEKYQDLFYFAAKFCGRLILQNKGTHNNLATACTLFESKYSELGLYKRENMNRSPLSILFELLINYKGLDAWQIYEACEEFFNSVVFDIAREEKINIKYHFVVGKTCLYGVNDNRDMIKEPYRNYLKYLIQNGNTGNDIKDFSTKVDLKKYES